MGAAATVLENREALDNLREQSRELVAQDDCRILICAGTGCLAGGSAEICDKFRELAGQNENVSVEFGREIAHVGVKRSGCHGFCEMGPLVQISR